MALRAGCRNRFSGAGLRMKTSCSGTAVADCSFAEAVVVVAAVVVAEFRFPIRSSCAEEVEMVVARFCGALRPPIRDQQS